VRMQNVTVSLHPKTETGLLCFNAMQLVTSAQEQQICFNVETVNLWKAHHQNVIPS